MSRLKERVTKLEGRRGNGLYPYVIRLSTPPTAEEQAQMARNRATGQPFAIMPHKCASSAEWMARYADRMRHDPA